MIGQLGVRGWRWAVWAAWCQSIGGWVGWKVGFVILVLVELAGGYVHLRWDGFMLDEEWAWMALVCVVVWLGI